MPAGGTNAGREMPRARNVSCTCEIPELSELSSRAKPIDVLADISVSAEERRVYSSSLFVDIIPR
ncbi:hypothetical protein BDY17DRAFT_17227 [Neohortaea acidophila]|uniref:Uncharacterized protein n=1 Tax=Neohortaea acidophila TaxID=245834 RepID=A0A6A6Q6Z2_9PEZI|nr:uncharacterized protein BDY17DRAFT_17227 [Neohortaea acidophila]KAF2487736.1 hypothetical protein BDY17DRAFT_17227 [Neohortaea acidophila]